MTEKFEISSTSLFVGHGYVQHAARRWRGERCFRFHSYLLPEYHGLPDAIAFAYGISTALKSKEVATSLERGLGQQTADSIGDAMMRGGPIQGSNSKNSKPVTSA